MSFSNRMAAALYPPIGAVPNTVQDYAGNNDGTNLGAKVAVVNGRGGLEFDGSANNRVILNTEIGDDLDLTEALTSVASVTVNRTDRQYVISRNDSGGFSDTQYLLGTANGEIEVVLGGSDFTAPFPPSWGQVFSTPHFIAVSWDGLEVKIYGDGELLRVENLTEALFSKPNMQLSGRNGSPSFNWDGFISDVQIWNYARTQSEIQADMHKRLTGNEPGLVGYWPMAYNAHR